MSEATSAAATASNAAPVPTTPAPQAAANSRPTLSPRVREALQKPASSQTKPAVVEQKKSASPAVPSAVAPAPPQTSNDAASTWKTWFNDWPESVPRRGIVVNSLDEAMPFKGFMVRGDTLLLERTNPDTLGARFLLVPFAEIAVVKFVDPLKQAVFEAAGFKGQLAG